MSTTSSPAYTLTAPSTKKAMNSTNTLCICFEKTKPLFFSKTHVYNKASEPKGGSAVRYRTHGRPAIETRVDYVESRLDEAISSLKEAVRDNKEAMQQMENRHQASFAELKSSLEKIVSKAESSRRWAIGTVITIAVAVIGFMLTVIGFLLTNGFQVQF